MVLRGTIYENRGRFYRWDILQIDIIEQSIKCMLVTRERKKWKKFSLMIFADYFNMTFFLSIEKSVIVLNYWKDDRVRKQSKARRETENRKPNVKIKILKKKKENNDDKPPISSIKSISFVFSLALSPFPYLPLLSLSLSFETIWKIKQKSSFIQTTFKINKFSIRNNTKDKQMNMIIVWVESKTRNPSNG